MKFVQWFSLLLISFFCATGMADDRFSLAGQWYFVPSVPPDWQSAIPRDATPFTLKGNIFDLDRLLPKPGKENDECVVYNRFESDFAGQASLGIGCDWYFEAFVNGKQCASTMDSGNATAHYNPWNNPFSFPVRKGTNLLAVKVKRGSLSWQFVCAPLRFQSGADVLEPGTPAPAAKKAPFGNAYQLILLGDTHFDAPYEVYHRNYQEPDARLNQIQRAEFQRNEIIWREYGPRLLKGAQRQITPQTRAVIQVGDLIQGDCGNPEVHSRMLSDTLTTFKRAFQSLPFLTVVGNHDIRGPGAAEAYRNTLLPYLTQELEQPITGTTFYFKQDQDLFLFIDFNDPNVEVIQEAFAAYPDARYKFVVTHGPVLPSDSPSCFWFLFGGSDPLRKYMRELFLQNEVIVLTGHEHVIELLECTTGSGRITQLMANSVWSNDSLARYVLAADSPRAYGSELRAMAHQEKGLELLNEYQQAVSRYWKAQGAGFFRLDISPDGVTAYYFGGDARTPDKVFRLR